MTAGARLRRTQRLRAAAVTAALKSGRSRRVQRFVLHVHTNPFGYPRLALVVPKRLVKKAVERNRIRRLAREAFRQRQEALGGRDFVVRLTRAPERSPITFLELDRLFAGSADE